MKKIALGAIILILAGLALPVSNLLVGKPSGTELTAHQPKSSQLAPIASSLEQSCAYCHVKGAARPFYAALPVASSIIEQDVKAGLQDLELVEALYPEDGSVVSEPTLARLEREVQSGEMPPAKFLLLHWNGRLAPEEQASLLAWVKDARASQAVEGVPESLRGAVIRPLPASVRADPSKVTLGQKLYHDTRLSGDNTLSCASCHDLARGGTDNAKVSTGIRGQLGGINAPTTYNAGFQFKQFWDGRAATLQDQAAGPPANPIEMGATWEGIVLTLNQDEALVAEFLAIYPDGITQNNVTDAIAEFERTLVTPDSPFDRYLTGDASALEDQAKRGYTLFQDKGCATCHVGELLGGKSFEPMGRRADYFAARGNLTDADQGRFSVTRLEKDRHRFKVPTLRNVARTAPYFHDGSQANLQDAVKSMAHYELAEPLTDDEGAALVKFLESLTGSYQGKTI